MSLKQKKINISSLLVALFLSLVFFKPVDLFAVGSVDTEAEQVITQYFNALINGDTATIRGLLGTRLLKQRSRLLSNPVYGDKLRELYGNANFEVLSKKVVSSAAAVVVVEVIYNTNDKATFKFLLMEESPSGMKIFREDEVL